MEEIFFCPNCMAKIAPIKGKCPVCGCDVNMENAPHQLPVNTILNGRYVTGRALREDRQSITYIAYDLRLNIVAAIKEYYPRGSAGRKQLSVSPADAYRSTFEAGKDHFLKEMSAPVKDSFKENGTVYIVTEHRSPAAQPGKSPSPARLKKRMVAIGAAALVVLAACIAVPKAIDSAKQRELELVQEHHLAELAAAREEAAAHTATTIGAGYFHTVGVRTDGTVEAVGGNYFGECDVSDWTDIIAVSAGISRTVGLRSDGTVAATYENSKEYNISEWSGIVAVSDGTVATLGLRSDGTVIATKYNKDIWHGVSDWSDIVAVSAGGNHAVGLKSDGTVVAAGDNGSGECDVSDWSDIIAVSAGDRHTVGLKLDGTVIAVGDNGSSQCSVYYWRNIKLPREDFRPIEDDTADEPQLSPEELAAAREAIAPHLETTLSSSSTHTAGIRADGTVAVTSTEGDYSDWENITAVDTDFAFTVGLRADGTVMTEGRDFDVADWTGITAIAAGSEYLVGLRSDGTVAAAGDNSKGQCDVSDWTDIVAVDAGCKQTVGLKADGTIIAAGENSYGQFQAFAYWKNIISISTEGIHTVGLKADGTVVAVGWYSDGRCDVSDWTDIVAVSAGDSHTVGLRSDGTVVAVGRNDWGQCDVTDWTDIVAICAGIKNTLGLRSDGTVVAVGRNDSGQCDVTGWKNIRLPSTDNDVVGAGTL